MKEIATQFLTIWKDIKPLQKLAVLAVVFFVTIVLGIFVLKAKEKRNSEKKNQAIEDQLLELGASNASERKGFELFDTNTWIKGEKELQVLEMRALKGQLETDIAGFDQIKSASVILDMAPGKSFGAKQYKTKASVILTLMPGARLSLSQMRAITNHLAGAVHGLEPNMIAISDTTGKLYKAIDPDGEAEFISNAALEFEEHLEQKIGSLLSVLVGEEHFFATVQAMMEKGDEHPRAFSIVVAIDQEHADVVKDVEKYLQSMLKGYEVPFYLAVEPAFFEKKKSLWEETRKGSGYLGLIVTAFVVILALLSLYPLFRRYSNKKREESLFNVMTRIDIKKLAESIEGEDPETIALMLSYLEPARAEQLLASFPQEYQEEVLNHLSELEYDNY